MFCIPRRKKRNTPINRGNGVIALEREIEDVVEESEDVEEVEEVEVEKEVVVR